MRVKKGKKLITRNVGLKAVSVLALSGLPLFFVNNSALALIISFTISVLLDPVAITYFSESWKQNFWLNGILGLIVGSMVWIFVWMGARYAEPYFYAPAWGLCYLLAAVVVPSFLNNSWKSVTPVMWAFLVLGLLFISLYLLEAAKTGLITK